jgi:hypothetical protein
VRLRVAQRCMQAKPGSVLASHRLREGLCASTVVAATPGSRHRITSAWHRPGAPKNTPAPSLGRSPQNALKRDPATRRLSVKLSAVLFAAPNAGNAAFAAAFGATVNGRRVVYATDIVPQVGPALTRPTSLAANLGCTS